MKISFKDKDQLESNDSDLASIESCDCQGICICEPGLEIDEEDEFCDNCCCQEEDDEFDLDIES